MEQARPANEGAQPALLQPQLSRAVSPPRNPMASTSSVCVVGRGGFKSGGGGGPVCVCVCVCVCLGMAQVPSACLLCEREGRGEGGTHINLRGQARSIELGHRRHRRHRRHISI